MADTNSPKREEFRVQPQSCELREGGDGKPVLAGQLAVFNEWSEISSRHEGHFMERMAPGAFTKTIRENRERMRVLFHHGKDPSIGMKPLGPISRLDADESGVNYEVPLLDTSYNRDIEEMLLAGVLGSSFAFEVLKDDRKRRPGRSAHNPKGLDERTVLEVRMREFGPTPFPAYASATAGMRSISDTFVSGEAAETRVVSERLYERATELVSETAWLMQPAMLATAMAIIAERREGYTPTQEEIDERIGARSEPTDAPLAPVRVIDVLGAIIPKATLMGDISGATSVEQLQTEFRAALADPSVKSIVFNVDSPGGSSRMIPEFAAEILAARGEKPIIAVANTDAASAAYYLASQADEIVVTPSGEVGSIGVWTAHTDISGMQEKAGLKTQLISAGKYKVEGNPFEALSDDAAAHLQETVDEVYDGFIAAVAAGRGVDATAVREGFGEGRMVSAARAVKAGMADRVATLDETLARLRADAQAETQDDPEAAPAPKAHDAAEGDDVGDALPEGRAAQYAHPIHVERRGPDPLYPGKKEEAWRL